MSVLYSIGAKTECFTLSENIKSNQSNVRAYSYMSIGLIGLAIVIRLLGLNKGIWLDEYYSLKIILSKDMFATFGMYDDQPPLYLILLRLWSNFSTSESFLRVFSVILGSGTVIVVMVWLKRFSFLASIISGLMCATLPIMLRYSQELRNYPLFVFSTALSFLFASRIVANPASLLNYVGLASSLCTIVASHLVGIAMVTSVFVFLVLSHRDLSRTLSPRVIVSFVAPTLVFVYILFVWTPWIPNSSNWWMPPFSLDLATTTVNYVFGMPSLLAFADSLKPYNLGWVTLLEYLVPLAMIICVTALAIWGDWRRSWSLLIAALVFWIQIIGYSIFVTPVFWYRTVFPGMIPFVGFMGLQLATISVKRIRWIAITAIVFLSSIFVIRWSAAEAYIPYETWKQVAQVLVSNWQADNLVVFYPSYIDGPIKYYDPALQSEDTILVGLGADMNEGISELGKRTIPLKKGGHSVVFLIVRSDANVGKDLVSYHNLLNYLGSDFGPMSFSQSFGIISISKYEFDASKSN